MKRHRLSGKEVKALNELLLQKYGLADFLGRQANVELVEDKFVQVNGETQFFYLEEVPIPVLKLILKNNFLKKAAIDMPAVKFIANGADVMRPGIKELDNFAAGDIIAIVDEHNKKPLAIGQALFSSEELQKLSKGKALKNLHYVGDFIWKGEIGHAPIHPAQPADHQAQPPQPDNGSGKL
jgi:PUA-domain protein